MRVSFLSISYNVTVQHATQYATGTYFLTKTIKSINSCIFYFVDNGISGTKEYEFYSCLCDK